MKKVIYLLLILFLSTHLTAQINDSSIRMIHLSANVNFRDIGGYKTNSGKQVKWNMIYRSAEINKLTEADLNELEKRKINFDFDFRGLEESKKAPDILWKNVQYIRCGAGSESTFNWIQSLKNIKDGDSLMLSFYTKIDSFGIKYKPLFIHLLNQNDNEATLYHCSAGKDRTGIATAFILYSLDVPEETIFEDYEATNYYRENENKKMQQMMSQSGIDKNVVASMMLAKRNYLKATFQEIIKQYGSLDNFLEKELGISSKEKEILKKKFLE